MKRRRLLLLPRGKIASQKNPRRRLLQKPLLTRALPPPKWPPRPDHGMSCLLVILDTRTQPLSASILSHDPVSPSALDSGSLCAFYIIARGAACMQRSRAASLIHNFFFFLLSSSLASSLCRCRCHRYCHLRYSHRTVILVV